MATSNNSTTESKAGGRKAGAFDIRTLIALLIGTYGVVLTIMGLIGPSASQLAKSYGLNINLWAGLGMVVTAAAFQAWAMWRPVIVPEDVHAGGDGTDDDQRPAS